MAARVTRPGSTEPRVKDDARPARPRSCSISSRYGGRLTQSSERSAESAGAPRADGRTNLRCRSRSGTRSVSLAHRGKHRPRAARSPRTSAATEDRARDRLILATLVQDARAPGPGTYFG